MLGELLFQQVDVLAVVLLHLLEDLGALLVAVRVLEELVVGGDRLQLVLQRRDEIVGKITDRAAALVG